MGSGFSIAQVGRNWRKTFRSRLSGISGVPSGMLPPCWESSQKPRFIFSWNSGSSSLASKKEKRKKEKKKWVFCFHYYLLNLGTEQISFGSGKPTHFDLQHPLSLWDTQVRSFSQGQELPLKPAHSICCLGNPEDVKFGSQIPISGRDHGKPAPNLCGAEVRGGPGIRHPQP